MIFMIRDEKERNMIDVELYTTVEGGDKYLECSGTVDIISYTDRLIELTGGKVGIATKMMFTEDVQFFNDTLREEVLNRFNNEQKDKAIDYIRRSMKTFADSYDMRYIED